MNQNTIVTQAISAIVYVRTGLVHHTRRGTGWFYILTKLTQPKIIGGIVSNNRTGVTLRDTS